MCCSFKTKTFLSDQPDSVFINRKRQKQTPHHASFLPLPGGYVCMTTRGNHDNLEYKAALENELALMEGAGLWGHVAITEVEDWEKAVAEPEKGYIPGVVYVYRKSSQ